MNQENTCIELNAMLKAKQEKIRQEAIEEFRNGLLTEGLLPDCCCSFCEEITIRKYYEVNQFIKSYNLPIK